MRSSAQSEELQEVLDTLDIEDYLSLEGVDFKITPGTSGVQLNLKECPRCGGNSWKVYLNMDSGLGNCFHGSCVGEPGFNKFSFIQYLHGDTPSATIRRIKQYALEAGWRPKRKISVATNNDLKVELPESIELPGPNNTMPKYLVTRNVPADIAAYFSLRYCSSGDFKYEDPVTGENKQQSYDRRIIIPVFDLEGTLKTFQGRDITDESDRKYLFPPGLSGTGRYLYNGHNCIGQEHIVVGEGAFDVFAIKMALDEHEDLRQIGQVGTFGKSISDLSDGDSQLTAFIALMVFGLKEITFMWDGEKSTLLSAVDAAQKVSSIGLKCNLAQLPENKDPAEATPAEVVSAFRRAKPVTRASAVQLKLKFMRM